MSLSDLLHEYVMLLWRKNEASKSSIKASTSLVSAYVSSNQKPHSGRTFLVVVRQNQNLKTKQCQLVAV